MMNNGSILYIPIQINGGNSVPENLLERELFIKNGELYVGTGNGEPTMIVGRVVEGAVIKSPTLSGTIKLGRGVVLNSNGVSDESTGTLVIVDDGNFELDESIDANGALLRGFASLVAENLPQQMNDLKDRIDNLESTGGTGGAGGTGGTSTGIVHTFVNAEVVETT